MSAQEWLTLNRALALCRRWGHKWMECTGEMGSYQECERCGVWAPIDRVRVNRRADR